MVDAHTRGDGGADGPLAEAWRRLFDEQGD
jgi:hypothetical protein